MSVQEEEEQKRPLGPKMRRYLVVRDGGRKLVIWLQGRVGQKSAEKKGQKCAT